MPTYRVTCTKPGEPDTDAGPFDIEAADQDSAIAAARKMVADPESWVWNAERVSVDI